MTTKIVYETECCDCCAQWIANGDDSSCRDYYGHEHPQARLSVAALDEIAKNHPTARNLRHVLELGNRDEDGYPLEDPEIDQCELCGQTGDYMHGNQVAALAEV